MKYNFSKYPKNWGLSQPDKNIDHRRVPNLMTFLLDMEQQNPLQQTQRTFYLETLYVGTLVVQ